MGAGTLAHWRRFQEGAIADFSAKIRRCVAQIRKVYAGREQFGTQALFLAYSIEYLRIGGGDYNKRTKEGYK